MSDTISLTTPKTSYQIRASGQLNKRPVECSADVKATNLLVAFKAFVLEAQAKGIAISTISVTEMKSNEG